MTLDRRHPRLMVASRAAHAQRIHQWESPPDVLAIQGGGVVTERNYKERIEGERG